MLLRALPGATRAQARAGETPSAVDSMSSDGGAERELALALLAAKYPQYVAEPPDGPVLAVDVDEVREWSAG